MFLASRLVQEKRVPTGTPFVGQDRDVAVQGLPAAVAKGPLVSAECFRRQLRRH
jgi:hypothetical protein